jgi:hypothetical protein
MTRRASYHSAPFHWVTLALSGVHNTKMARKALSDRVKALNRSKVKALLATHDHAVAAWKVECEGQKAAGVHMKDLPKKPTRPRKPTLASGEPGAGQQADLSSGPSSSDEE